ncbi:hypothetical protein C0Q70_07500 [Pomacea canaliculata]|uniref:Uncharacterized protein n=1 Tax=Pomacea canaliculata TaxID=400727 RepID=A0A2T7PF77_POMCA|nr:hypothetical protein C0Q70_07500 [Pomacea canaliculata]
MVKPDGSPDEDSSPGSSQVAPAAKGYAHLLKIILLGDSGTGKTALLRRHVEDVFEENHLPTIGVDFAVKSMAMPNEDMVKLQVWDTAGQERYRNMTTSYYRGAQAVLIVYDVTNQESRENVKKWIQEVRRYGSDVVIMAVVGTKVDLKETAPEFYRAEDLKMELEADGALTMSTLGVVASAEPCRDRAAWGTAGLRYTYLFKIWDTAGQERYRTITASYYRGAHAAVIMYDPTRLDTLQHVQHWLSVVKANVRNDVMVVLVASRLDLKHTSEEFYGARTLPRDVERRLHKDDVAGPFEVSAKTGEGVARVFQSTIDKLVAREVAIRGSSQQQDKTERRVSLVKTPVKNSCCSS